MSQLGPIAGVLEEEIKEKLRQRGIVVWLDRQGHYTDYVDQLVERYEAEDFFAPVVPFRGSFLEMLLALEAHGNGLDQEALLIHVPGHTTTTIRQTPLLELYRAGHCFLKGFESLVREAAVGKVSPAAVEAYLDTGVTDLASAESWLQAETAQPQDGLSSLLTSRSLESLLDGLLGLEGMIADASKLKSLVQTEADLDSLIQHLNRHTGIDDAFLTQFQGGAVKTFQDFAEGFTAWLLTVEYVNDLTRLPELDYLKPLRQLAANLKKTCGHLIDHLRDRHPDTYATQASNIENRLEAELAAISPEDFGKIDTFQREETAVLEAAVQALIDADWSKALAWAKIRAQNPSFWVKRDRSRRLEWLLIHDAAALGCAIAAAHPLDPADTLTAVLDRYTQSGYQIDLAHRLFEQQRLKLLEPTLEHYGALQEVGDRLRQHYRTWADQLAQSFATICESEGFLPEPDLQQRTLYDQVVHPLVQTNRKVAYFLIDAFRYEMATELLPDFEGPGTTAVLKGRFAELPSITAVGMNVLAPVSKAGRLTLAGRKGFSGFKTGEYTVKSPDERFRAMREKSVSTLGADSRSAFYITLTEVNSCSADSLKRKGLGKANLVVVHSREIDDAGEANVGLPTFETWLRQIRTAWSHLKSIGFNEFVFTADHGFLLQDQMTKPQPYGSIRDPDRRYVLMAEPRSEAGSVTVSLSALQYEGRAGYLLFRRDTAPFKTGISGATFVHGGNSLQERVIPVLTVSHRHSSDSIKLKYLVEVRAEPELLGFSRMQLRVKPAPGVQLTFIGARTIGLSLRVSDRPDIQLTIKDAPKIEIKNQVLQVPVESDWVEVLFDLKGQQAEKVPIEVYHPDGTEDVEPTLTAELFRVAGTLKLKEDDADPAVPSLAGPNLDWQERFEDVGLRQIFIHIQQHGSINEAELNQMLGSPRQVRRFSMEFEEHLKLVPFSVRIETTASGKRYVKQQ